MLDNVVTVLKSILKLFSQCLTLNFTVFDFKLTVWFCFPPPKVVKIKVLRKQSRERFQCRQQVHCNQSIFSSYCNTFLHRGQGRISLLLSASILHMVHFKVAVHSWWHTTANVKLHAVPSWRGIFELNYSNWSFQDLSAFWSSLLSVSSRVSFSHA